MQTVVSVKKPMRRASGREIESSLMVLRLRPIVAVGSGGLCVVLAGQRRGPARRAARPYVAHERPWLVGRDIRGAGEGGQGVCGVARAVPPPEAPVPRG